MRVLWDMDGVAIPGRGTTYLAEGHDAEPRYFMRKFLLECGQEGTPLYHTGRDDLANGILSWERARKNPVRTIGELAECLTDLRYTLKIFPGEEQTIYTKNAILAGMPMRRVAEIAGELPYNYGLGSCVGDFRMAGLDQVLFSANNAALVDAVSRIFGIRYGGATTPRVVMDGEERDYSPGFFGRDDVALAGAVKNGWDKRGAVLNYFDRSIGYADLVAIDDTQIGLLAELRSRGARVFGFYNEHDVRMPDKRDAMRERGIAVVESPEEFRDAVLQHK